MNKPILCVDFDGVIHSYTSGWKGADVITDVPVKGALRWLWKATEWFDIHVYSARSKEFRGREAMRAWMLEHSRSEFGPIAQRPKSEKPKREPAQGMPEIMRRFRRVS